MAKLFTSKTKFTKPFGCVVYADGTHCGHIHKNLDSDSPIISECRDQNGGGEIMELNFIVNEYFASKAP